MLTINKVKIFLSQFKTKSIWKDKNIKKIKENQLIIEFNLLDNLLDWANCWLRQILTIKINKHVLIVINDVDDVFPLIIVSWFTTIKWVTIDKLNKKQGYNLKNELQTIKKLQ